MNLLDGATPEMIAELDQAFAAAMEDLDSYVASARQFLKMVDGEPAVATIILKGVLEEKWDIAYASGVAAMLLVQAAQR